MSKKDRELVKVYDKVRKAAQRQNLTEEEKEEKKKKDRERKAASRAKGNTAELDKDMERKAAQRLDLTEEEKEETRKKNREWKAASRAKWKAYELDYDMERKAVLRQNLKEEEKEENKKKDRERKASSRAKRTPDEVEYDNIETLLTMRKVRENRDGKKHLLDNLKAKKGMQAAKEKEMATGSKYGPKRKEETIVRIKKNTPDTHLWMNYWETNSESKKIMHERRPLVAEAWAKQDEEAAEKKRQAKEEEAKKEAQRFKEGYWEYNPTMDDYYWVGEGPAPPTDEYRSEAPVLTEEEEREYLKNKVNI